VIQSQRHFLATRRIVRQFAQTVDLLFLRLPFQVPLAVRRLGKPKLMHIISNPGAIIAASSDYRGLTKFVAQRFANHSMATMRRMVREPDTRVASNGREMFEYLKPRAGRVVVSSCIHESEMRPRTDLRLASPPRLLFVGYLRPEKGVHTLLDAFEDIRRRRPVRLTLVGGTDKITQAEARIRQRIDCSPFKDDITLTGLIPFGDPLFELYRSHDVYVLPSLSEGTPRTLVEARAFGCPVVATRVGGIPTSVVDGQDGLLCDPNEPTQLASAIEQILDNEPLRLGLIEQGLRSARRLTVEAFASQLVDELAALVRECHLGNSSTNCCGG
jgi:glycosyltransferase involved in cell wall biosynthesis